jgi:hypothetical protein
MALAKVQVVKVDVDSSPLFRGNGDVKQWMSTVQRTMTEGSKRFAPRRSGALVAGIRGTVATTGRRRVQGSTWSYAPHTRFVVYGTGSPILSNVGWSHGIGEGKSWILVPGKYGPMPRGVKFHYLKLSAGGGYPTLYRDHVRGQKSNNFFFRAYVVTRARHRSLPERRPAVRVGLRNGVPTTL